MQVGNKVVFTNAETGLKAAGKIAEIKTDGIITLTEVTLEEVVSSLVLSDIASVSAEDIFLENDVFVADGMTMPLQQDVYVMETGWFDPIAVDENGSHKGFTASVYTKDNELKVEVTNEETKESKEIASMAVEGDAEVKATVGINEINMGLQALFDGQLEYVTAQVETDLFYSGEISISEEKRIPLFTAPIKLAWGLASVDINFYLVLSIDGTMSIEAEMPMQVAIDYVRGNGINIHKNLSDFTEPVIEIDCKAEAKLRMEPVVKILCIDKNVLDVQADFGVQADASLISRSNSPVEACADIAISVPILRVALPEDNYLSEGLDLIEENFNTEIPREWEILTEENTLFHKALHGEWYKNNSFKFVEKCTYKEKENAEISTEFPHSYHAYFTTEFTDKGDYYEVTGKLLDRVHILKSIIDNMNTGEIYSYDNIDFQYVRQESYEDGETYYILTDSNGNEMLIDAHTYGYMSYGNDDAITYYDVIHVGREQYSPLEEGRWGCEEWSPGKNYYYGTTGFLYIEVADNYVFKIPKDLFVNIDTSITSYENGGLHISSESFMIKDIFENNIQDVKGNVLTKVTGMPVLVDFDEEENITGLSLKCEGFPGEYISVDGTIKFLSEVMK